MDSLAEIAVDAVVYLQRRIDNPERFIPENDRSALEFYVKKLRGTTPEERRAVAAAVDRAAKEWRAVGLPDETEQAAKFRNFMDSVFGGGPGGST